MRKFTFILMPLQTFAYDPQAQPINNTGSATLSAEMKTFYDKNLIEEAGPELIHDQFAQIKDIPQGSGKEIEFRRYASLPKATDKLVEGVTPAGKNLSVSTIKAEVSQYGDFITYTDMLDMTAIDDNVLEGTILLGKQAGVTLDTITRNVLQSGTNVSFCPKVSGGVETTVEKRTDLDDTSVITVKKLQQCFAKFKAQNAPTINGKYVAIIHPYAAYDLMRDEEWVKPHQYVNTENVYKNEIGEIAGFRFVESSEAMIYCGADLASDSRNLAVNGAVTNNAGKTITFDGGTVEANALKGRYILVDGKKYLVASNTTTVITVDSTNNLPPISDNTVIYPGEGGKEGRAVFGTLLIAENAYGTTKIENGGLETIVKQLGSAGAADPLNQRGTVGWKATKTAEILVENYLQRLESCSPVYQYVEGN